MKISILCVGKIKEKYYTDAVGEYIKRLSKYAKTAVIEVADEKTPDGASAALEAMIKNKEGERLLDKWDEHAFTFVLAIDAPQRDSVAFAKEIDKLSTYGKSHIQFVIGGSLGLSDAVMKKADALISFSKMTFPHQLMRVVLLEQIYRAYRIIKGEPYHK